MPIRRLPEKEELLTKSEIARTLNEVMRNLGHTDPVLSDGIGEIEPTAQYLREGKIAYADGTNWNPNSEGAGYYFYTGSVWVRLLDDASTPTSQPIWDETVTGSAVTSVTTDGTVTLDGNTHGGYLFYFFIKMATTASYNMNFSVNNDKTAANYTRQHDFNNGATPLASGATDAIIDGTSWTAGNSIQGFGHILISPDGDVIFQWKHYRKSGTLYRFDGAISKIATVTNITRIDIDASTGNNIDVNSRFRLWRMM